MSLDVSPVLRGEAGGSNDEELFRGLIGAIQRQEPLSVIQEYARASPLLLMKKDANGWLPLHYAASCNAPLDVVQGLVDWCPRAVQDKDREGQLPLHIAAQFQASLEVVQCLADKGPDALLVQRKAGWLPLHLAVQFSSTEVVQYLANKCPEALLLPNDAGYLPLHLAAAYASLEVVNSLADKAPDAALVRQNDGWLPIHLAVRYAPLEAVECLADKCPDALLVKDEDGWLPLHLAAQDASFEVVQYLADKCPDSLLVKGNDGWLPLHVAARSESLEVARYLADKCPDALVVKDVYGCLPLHVAAKNNAPAGVVQCLVERCPEALLVKQKDGMLPLHSAAAFASLEVVQCLADKAPAAALVKDIDGWLPLHFAAQHATVEVVQCLADRSAGALLVKENRGWLPLHVAAQDATLEVARCLADKAPDALLDKQREGKLPVDVARTFNREHPDVVAWLEVATRDRQDRELVALSNERSTASKQDPLTTQASKWLFLGRLVRRRGKQKVGPPLSVWDEKNRLPGRLGKPSETEDTAMSEELPTPPEDAKALPESGTDDRKDSPMMSDRLSPAMKHPTASPDEKALFQRLLADQIVPAGPDEELSKRLITAFHQPGPLSVVQEIIRSDPQLLRKQNAYGWLPLHHAARCNASLEVVRCLVENCPDAQLVKNHHGWLPMHVASQHASLEVVQCLADNCPDALLVKDMDGYLPLHVAAQYALLEVVQCLADKCPDALLVKSGSEKLPVDVARVYNNERPDVAVWLDAAMQDQRNRFRVPDDRLPNATVARVSDAHKDDRDLVRQAIERPPHKPALVSVSYVLSIKTQIFLGDGFFGTVYKGADPILGRDFAIKSINTEILRGGTQQELEGAMKNFKTEQEALSRFRHPNIAALFAYTDPMAGGNAADCHLVYELAEKGSLDRYLKDDLGRSRLGSFRRRVQVATDVMMALQFLHKGSDQMKTCFHRDVKPANIVLKRDFTAQLIDCGMVTFVNDAIETTSITGTIGYIDPAYVDTGEYTAACDIYSFGVVLLELWTGRLQNSKGASGAAFNFKGQYINEKREVTEDVDVAMDFGNPLPKFADRYATLALQCIRDRRERRPSGDDVLQALQSILDECYPSSDRPASNSGGDVPRLTSSTGANVCATCRTFNRVPNHSICALCRCREDIRKGFTDMVLSSMHQSAGGMWVDALSNKIAWDLEEVLDPKLKEICEQIDVIARIDAALPVLAHLDRRLNNQVPRTFILVPANIKSGWEHPRSWLRSTVLKKYYLFFVCPASQRAISPPIKLKVAKDWLRKIAPVLASGLFLLQVEMKAGLNVNLDLDGTAPVMFHVSAAHIAEMLQELSAILDESSSCRGMLDRLRAQQLSEDDVRELSGDAYELVLEKACEQSGWRSQMEPVRVPPSPSVFWVAKSVAADPKYEIVKE